VWKGLYDVADGRIDEARRAFSKALQIEPGRADARTYLDRLAEFAGGVTAAEGNRATAAP
jgi:hypothetical protein